MQENPYTAPPAEQSPEQPPSEKSLPRGCAYGCLYSGCAWIFMGAVITLGVVPLAANYLDLDARKLGALLGQASLWLIALPFGIYGLITHWRNDHNKQPTKPNQTDTDHDG